MNDILIYLVYDQIQVLVSVAVAELVLDAETKKKCAETDVKLGN